MKPATQLPAPRHADNCVIWAHKLTCGPLQYTDVPFECGTRGCLCPVECSCAAPTQLPATTHSGHCVGTFWTEKEITAINDLAKRLELSPEKVIQLALRSYQLQVVGEPNLGPKSAEPTQLPAVAKLRADLLCPPHASLDKNGKLEDFDNCIACIRNERDELNRLIQRISTNIAQTIIEDPIKAAEGWALHGAPVLSDIQAVCEQLHRAELARLEKNQ